MIFESIIIGGGPAGCAAAVYSARKKMTTLLIVKEFGGQSFISDSIGNWIGSISISGLELAESLKKHVLAQEDIQVREGESVASVRKLEEGDVPVFEVKTDKETYRAYSVLVASGGRRRKLGIPGEKDHEGRGVVYCSTCDAPLFRDKVVAVVGGGNAGLEAVVDLFPYAKKIYLLVRSDTLKGDPSTQEEVKNSDKVEIIFQAQTQEIYGKAFVEGARYTDAKGKTRDLPLQGVFVEIGSVPNSEIVKDVVALNERGEIIVDHQVFTTSQKGIFAAGDVTDERYKQNNISVGNAISATLTMYDYILQLRKKLNGKR